jgi:hypothetical protein
MIALLCQVCGKKCGTLKTFRAHMNSHASSYELNRPIRCSQDDSKSNVEETFNFFRHIRHLCTYSSDTNLQAVKPYHGALMLVVANSSSSGDHKTFASCALPVTGDDDDDWNIHAGKYVV